MPGKTFDLASLMARQRMEIVSDSDTIRRLQVDELHDNSGNFYSVDDVRELADSIAVAGVLQPILVRPRAEGGYVIIAGHRRTRAVRTLREEWTGEGANPWDTIPAVLRPAPTNRAEELLEELALVTTNSSVRKLSDQELSRQVEKITEILYGLKGEGYEFPGRMRKTVAEAVGVSESKLARIKTITEKLCPGWLERWKAGSVPEYTAEALAKVRPKIQEALLFKRKLDPEAVRELAAYYQRCHDKRPCRERPDASCDHGDQHWAVGSRKDSEWLRCPVQVYSSAGICCGSCHDILKCEQACAPALTKAKTVRQEAEAAQKKEKSDRERQAAARRLNADKLWIRFRYMREQAGISAEAAQEALSVQNHELSVPVLENREGLEKLAPYYREATPEGVYGFRRCFEAARLFQCPVEALTDPDWKARDGGTVPGAKGGTGELWWRPFPRIRPADGQRALVLRGSGILGPVLEQYVMEAKLAVWKGGDWFWASRDEQIAGIRVEQVEYWLPEPKFRVFPEEEDHEEEDRAEEE